MAIPYRALILLSVCGCAPQGPVDARVVQCQLYAAQSVPQPQYQPQTTVNVYAAPGNYQQRDNIGEAFSRGYNQQTQIARDGEANRLRRDVVRACLQAP